MKIAIGMLAQEVLAFSPISTTMADFETIGITYGAEIIDQFSNVSAELGGFIQAAYDEKDVELIPTMAAVAWPSGKCDQETHQYLKNRMLKELKNINHLDGILLSLHGAMSAEGEPDVEGDLLESIRREWDVQIPIIISLDHHANITQKMVGAINALVGYKTEPHIDSFETGVKAAQILFSTIHGEINPIIRWRKIPMIAAGNLCTPAGPLGEFFKKAAILEKDEKVLDISIFPEFTWSDNPELGWSVVVVTDNAPELAQTIADQLAKGIWDKREQFLTEDKLSPIEAVNRALEIEGGPIVFSDAADAPTAGAPGDSPVILKELLGKKIKGKAMLPIVDPDAVKSAIHVGVGADITLEVGGKFDTINFQSIKITGKIRTITDGRFVIRDKVGQDSKVNMKRTVVLEVDDVYVVLSEAKGPSHVPSFYRSVGLDPKEAKIVVAKSPYLFRAAYEPIAKEIILVDAPGMCSSDLSSLAALYKTPPRPLFPLDKGVTFQI